MDVTFKNVEREDCILLEMLAKRLGIEVEIVEANKIEKSDPISNIDKK